MKVAQLKAFVQIAESHTYAEAAENLHLSQPAGPVTTLNPDLLREVGVSPSLRCLPLRVVCCLGSLVSSDRSTAMLRLKLLMK